jgi:hypothetical protein
VIYKTWDGHFQRLEFQMGLHWTVFFFFILRSYFRGLVSNSGDEKTCLLLLRDPELSNQHDAGIYFVPFTNKGLKIPA